jgi:hypothetical protein
MQPGMQNGRWKIEPGLYRNSLNAMLDNKKLDVTEAMMREKTIGVKAMMGPEWQPSGIISRQIAALLTDEKPGNEGGIMARLPQRVAKPHRVSAGGDIMAPISKSTGQLPPLALGHQRQMERRGPPPPAMPREIEKHQTDWQMMSRASPYADAFAAHVATTYDLPAPAPKQPHEQPWDPLGPAPLESRPSPSSMQSKNLPRRMALGSSSSPTQAWYPGLENVGKMGQMGNAARA